MELVRDALFSRVKDKAGFFAAYNNFLRGKDALLPIGELEDLVVTVDTATGQAKVTSSSTLYAPPAPKKVFDQVYQTFKFRKIDGKWLID